MKYMLLMNHAATGSEPAIGTCTAEDMQASGVHMDRIRQELVESGELLGAAGLAEPDTAKLVISGGDAPVVTDGPFAELKEFLAGYWLIDVDSEERAIEIAARTSAAPGAGGRPTRRPIEVRAVMRGADPEL